jgi:uncharacterized membrane protein
MIESIVSFAIYLAGLWIAGILIVLLANRLLKSKSRAIRFLGLIIALLLFGVPVGVFIWSQSEPGELRSLIIFVSIFAYGFLVGYVVGKERKIMGK